MDNEEERFKFLIATQYIDFVSRYLKGLNLSEERNYHCSRKLGIIDANLTIEQAQGLKEDMRKYITEMCTDFDVGSLSKTNPNKKRLEFICSQHSE